MYLYNIRFSPLQITHLFVLYTCTHSVCHIRPAGCSRLSPIAGILDPSQLHTSACQFLEAGLAKATRTRYLMLCQVLYYTSNWVYTNSICDPPNNCWHLTSVHQSLLKGLHDSFSQQRTPRLQIILKGIKKHQTLTHPPRVRLPITDS